MNAAGQIEWSSSLFLLHTSPFSSPLFLWPILYKLLYYFDHLNFFIYFDFILAIYLHFLHKRLDRGKLTGWDLCSILRLFDILLIFWLSFWLLRILVLLIKVNTSLNRIGVTYSFVVLHLLKFLRVIILLYNWLVLISYSKFRLN